MMMRGVSPTMLRMTMKRAFSCRATMMTRPARCIQQQQQQPQHRIQLRIVCALNMTQRRFVRGQRDPAEALTLQIERAFGSGKSERAIELYQQYLSEGHEKPPSLQSYRLLVLHYAMGQYPNGAGQDFKNAERVFAEMVRFGHKVPVEVYEAMLMGAVDSGMSERMSHYYQHMLSNGVKPTSEVYNALLAGNLMFGTPETVQKLHDEMAALGVPKNEGTDMLVKGMNGEVHEKLQSAVDEMKVQGGKDKEILQKGVDRVKEVGTERKLSEEEAFKLFAEQLGEMDKQRSDAASSELKKELAILKMESAELRRKMDELLQIVAANNANTSTNNRSSSAGAGGKSPKKKSTATVDVPSS